MRFPVLAALALALLSLGMTRQDAGGPRSPIMAPTGPLSAVAGELYLRIRKPAAVGGLRADVPTNAFAARAMRPVPDRVFRGRRE